MNGFHIDQGRREQLLKMIYEIYNWSIKWAKFIRILAKKILITFFVLFLGTILTDLIAF